MKELQGATPFPVRAITRSRVDGEAPGVPMRKTSSLLCRQCGLLIGIGLALAGCASTGTVAPPAPATAHLSVVNQTPYAWQIAVAGLQGGSARSLRVAARGTVELDLPGDNYSIEQTMLVEAGRPGTTRSLVTRLDAGQTYQWPLATLMSAPGDEEAGVRRP